jgi:anti-sigma28 factor (negative regulator of flagellin synthesis)
MAEFQWIADFFAKGGVVGILLLIFWVWHKAENARITSVFNLFVEQTKENNARIDKMIDMQHKDSERNFQIMRENQNVLLLQTRGIEQLTTEVREGNRKIDDLRAARNRRNAQ